MEPLGESIRKDRRELEGKIIELINEFQKKHAVLVTDVTALHYNSLLFPKAYVNKVLLEVRV